MSPEARDRLFGAQHAFDHPVTLAITLAVVVLLAIAPLVIKLMPIDAATKKELWPRYRSRLLLAPLMLAAILLGAAWTILCVGVLSLACYREYARATGLFREKTVSFMVVCGILAITFAVLDHWYNLFVALAPTTVSLIAIIAILADRPKGYIQRVALGVLGFLLFGACLGHLGYFANDARYRPVLLLILLAVELNDVFAFAVGKTFGRRQLVPNTSPNKTIAGAVGALVLTTSLVLCVAPLVFAGTVVAGWGHALVLGVMISVLAQFGDLMLSSVKRDVGIKDMATAIPGFGGLCDRFDGVILVAPAVFHYLDFVAGVGVNETPRLFTGG